MWRQLTNGKELDDAAFDFGQTIVILIEDPPRLGDVDRLLFGQLPRQFDEPVQIAAHHAVLGRRFRHAFEPPQFLAGLLLDVLGHSGFADRLAQFGDLGLALLAFPQLPADRRQLFAQQYFPLPLVERGLGLAPDFLRKPQYFDALREQARHLIHPRRDIDGFENLLLVLGFHVHVGSGKIRQLRRRRDRLHRSQQFGGDLRQKLQRLERLPLQIEEARLDFGTARGGLGNAGNLGHQERPALQKIHDLEALVALADEVVVAVGGGNVAHQIGNGADAI